MEPTSRREVLKNSPGYSGIRLETRNIADCQGRRYVEFCASMVPEAGKARSITTDFLERNVLRAELVFTTQKNWVQNCRVLRGRAATRDWKSRQKRLAARAKVIEFTFILVCSICIAHSRSNCAASCSVATATKYKILHLLEESSGTPASNHILQGRWPKSRCNIRGEITLSESGCPSALPQNPNLEIRNSKNA